VTNLEQFENVIANVHILELWVQSAEVGIVDILEDEGGCLALLGFGRVGLEWELSVFPVAKKQQKTQGEGEEDKGTYLVVANDIQKRNYVRAPRQILQDLDLTLYLLLLNGLENLYHTLLVVLDVDSLEDLGVFATTCRKNVSIESHQQRHSPHDIPIFLTTS
jgi:hypothetical protein